MNKMRSVPSIWPDYDDEDGNETYYSPDSKAPPMNPMVAEAMEKLARGELSGPASWPIKEVIVRFHPYRVAFEKLLGEHIKKVVDDSKN